MEELLGTVSNRDIVDYMRDALACYGAGIHRGCVVLSYIALFDDLRLKLAELAGVNAEAKRISREVEKRRGEQEIFETFMADQLRKAGLLTQADCEQLELIRRIRNKAAHPSGVHVPAEEARYVFHAVIVGFLSKPLLKATDAVDAIVARLGRSNLYPAADLEEIKSITEADIAGVHEAAYPYLVAELLRTRSNIDPEAERNARTMMLGLAALRRPTLARLIRSRLLDALSEDESYRPWLAAVVAADGSLLSGLSPATLPRTRAALLAWVESDQGLRSTSLRHSARILAAMLEALGEAAVVEYYGPMVDAVVARHPYRPLLLDALGDAPRVRAGIVTRWKENSASSTFDVSNAFADALPVLDDYATPFLTDADALELAAGVVAAAEWGSRRARSVRSQYFAVAPNIRAKASAHIEAKPNASLRIIRRRCSVVSSARDFLIDELGGGASA